MGIINSAKTCPSCGYEYETSTKFCGNCGGTLQANRDLLGNVLREWRNRAILPHISGRLLDIACGTNKLVRSYKGQGLGLDIFQWGDVDVVVENSSKLPFGECEFDTITIIGSLNYIPNRVEVLREVRRLLRPTGKLIVTMISPRVGKMWSLLRSPMHTEDGLSGLPPEEVRALLNGAGLKIASEKRFMVGMNRLTVAEKPNAAAKAHQGINVVGEKEVIILPPE